MKNFEGSEYRFDPHMGFSQFLEEARQHASSMNSETSLKLQGEGERRLRCEDGKKSWKGKVLSWLKSDKKSKTNKVSKESGSQFSNPRRFHVSGPIHGSERKVQTEHHQRPVSGPITFFNPRKRVDSQVPYMCLDSNLNSPKFQSQQGVNPYGPVYLVT